VTKEDEIKLVEVGPENAAETGFFCFQNRRKEEGFRRKLNWLKKRFDEGLKIQVIREGGRGFIEYIPGEYAWRPVDAKGYIFIHCLWVTGRKRNVGCATTLLNKCIEDAKAAEMKGIAMVTSESHFMLGKRFLLKHGFESVESAPPSFELMVKKFGNARPPKLTGNWDAKLKRYGKGFTIITSDQCPYFVGAVNEMTGIADELGVGCKVVQLHTCDDVRDKAPSPFGVFSIIYNGNLIGYYYLGKKIFMKRFSEMIKRNLV
jgi:hypothetical protein